MSIAEFIASKSYESFYKIRDGIVKAYSESTIIIHEHDPIEDYDFLETKKGKEIQQIYIQSYHTLIDSLAKAVPKPDDRVYTCEELLQYVLLFINLLTDLRHPVAKTFKPSFSSDFIHDDMPDTSMVVDFGIDDSIHFAILPPQFMFNITEECAPKIVSVIKELMPIYVMIDGEKREYRNFKIDEFDNGSISFVLKTESKWIDYEKRFGDKRYPTREW